MIDFHCHLDLFPNGIALVPEVNIKNIFTLAVTTSPRAWEKTSRLFSKYNNIKVALGFHPELVVSRISELDMMLQWAPTTSYIGEIGIDGSSRFKNTLYQQTEVFNAILDACGNRSQQVVSIHSRAAANTVLGCLESRNTGIIPILHWFTGTQKELERAIDIGCWFSINPSMLSYSSGVKLISKMPLDKIVPETDSPFTEYNGKQIMPWDAIQIANVLSSIHNITYADIVNHLKSNTFTLIRHI